jgi:thiamine pyrophosphokinase|tara:strand:+ start:319 stop:519 length:201 start_codon:yes stop_codon:yes gene_type:complete
MNNSHLEKIKDQYAEMVIDGMDYKTMERLVYDMIRGDMDSSTEEEIKEEIINFYDVEKWEEMTTSC